MEPWRGAGSGFWEGWGWGSGLGPGAEQIIPARAPKPGPQSGCSEGLICLLCCGGPAASPAVSSFL